MSSGDLKILAANIGSKAEAPRLATEIAMNCPHVVVVTEGYRARDFLDSIPGYRLRQYHRHEGPEAPNVALLVRDRLPIDGRKLVKMVRRWWGPFSGRARAPRRYQKLAVRVGWVRWPLLAIHFPPGGPSGGHNTHGKNAPAWAESRAFAGRWGSRHKRGAIVGDFNAKAEELEGLTFDVDGQLSMGGKVDACIGIGAHVVSERINPPEGMHGWALYTLTAEEV